jgi:isopentenyl phosphate kinase
MKILKVGGSAITDKSAYLKPLPERIHSMAGAIAKVWNTGVRDLIIVHGVGSFGHAPVIRHGIKDGVRSEKHKLGFADTHAACSELSLMLVKELLAKGIPAISLPPSALLRQDNKRISQFNDKIVFDYLGAGYLPVLYGDFVLDKSLGGSPCSGDQIMAWLGKKAEFLVFATNVDGVLDENGNVIPQITKTNFSEISKHLKETPNDVTGAMKGKVRELLEIGVPSYIVNADSPERVIKILMGEKAACTKIE